MGPFDLVTMSASHGDQAAIYQKHYLLIRFQTGNKINNLARGGPTSMTSIFPFFFLPSLSKNSKQDDPTGILSNVPILSNFLCAWCLSVIYQIQVFPSRWLAKISLLRKKKGKRIDRLTNGISWYQRVAKYRYSDSMLYRERDGNASMLHTL